MQAPARQAEAALPPQHVRQQDAHADHRRKARGEHRPKDPHPAGEDKEVVQRHVGQARAHRGQHGQARIPIVAHKADQHRVEQKRRREQQQHLQIRPRHVEDLFIRAQQARDLRRKQQPRRDEGDRGDPRQQQRHGIGAVARLPLALACADGELRRAAHAQHQPHAVDQVVDGDGQVQRGEPRGPQSLGDKERIRQNVARGAQRAQRAQGRVAHEFPAQFPKFLHVLSSLTKKAPGPHLHGLPMRIAAHGSTRRQNPDLLCNFLRVS